MPMLVFFLLGKMFTLSAGVYYFRWLTRPFRLAFWLVLVAAVAESLGYYINHFMHQPNVWLFNCYMIVEVFLLGSCAVFLCDSKKMRIVFLVLLAADLAGWIGNVIYMGSIFVFANLSMIVGSVILTFMYIVVLLNNSLFSRKGMFAQPVFWLAVSTLLYFGCDIPFMGLYNYFIKYSETGKQLYYINAVLDIIRYPLVGVSFILLGKNFRSVTPVLTHEL